MQHSDIGIGVDPGWDTRISDYQWKGKFHEVLDTFGVHVFKATPDPNFNEDGAGYG